VGEIYRGIIKDFAKDFGFYVRIDDSKTNYRKDGLVHVKEMQGQPRKA
jgi:predicted RNA-binding protein with RPS1 domain